MAKHGKRTRDSEAKVRNSMAVRRMKADILQALAHPTRIHIVEVLRDGELPAGTIAELVSMDPSCLSQHLSRLKSRRIILSRRDGNQIFYSLGDTVVFEVLDAMRRHLQGHMEEAMSILREVSA